MKVIRRDDAPEQDATDAPIFVGGKVTRRPLVSDGLSDYYNFNVVEFAPGARNKFHTHSSDQILFVTKGRGIVSTETEDAAVSEGDTILIAAGEKHRHGAGPDSAFAHISLTTPDSKTTIFDE